MTFENEEEKMIMLQLIACGEFKIAGTSIVAVGNLISSVLEASVKGVSESKEGDSNDSV